MERWGVGERRGRYANLSHTHRRAVFDKEEGTNGKVRSRCICGFSTGGWGQGAARATREDEMMWRKDEGALRTGDSL